MGQRNLNHNWPTKPFDRTTPASNKFFMARWGNTATYYIEVHDPHFGRVFCTLEEMYLPNEVPTELRPVEEWQVPALVKNQLFEAANDASKEWL